MSKLLVALLTWLMVLSPVYAADNTVVVTPGVGITLRSKDVGAGIESMFQIPGDTFGNPLATAPGVGNTSFALPMQGVAGGVNLPVILNTETTKVIGEVNQGTSPWVISGAVTNAGTFATQLTGATNNINNIAGTISLPTGASTLTAQNTGNTALTTINTTLGSPFQAGGSIGNSTFGATLGAETTKVIGTVRNLGNAGAITDFAGQNAASPANAWLMGGQFNTTPTTITNGNSSPLQLDNAGNLLVNVKTGGAGGGAVTIASTAVAAGAYTTGSIPDLATASLTDAASCASGTTVLACLRALNSTAGSAIPAGTNLIGAVSLNIAAAAVSSNNGIYTNLLIGNATPSVGTGAQNSTSPRVVVATDSATIAGTASAVGHGTAAAALRVELPTDGTGLVTANPATAANWGIVATAAAPPANAVYLGANASGATGGHVAGLIVCDSHVFKHITSATDTLTVQGVSSQTIRICGWRARAAGVATWYLEAENDTNANCSNLGSQLNGIATEAANTGEVLTPTFWSGLAPPSANGLCIKSTGTGGVDVDVWYTIF